jgi:hypothetical protein
MTKDEALDLALEALEYIENNYMSLPKSGNEAITAIKQARSSPVQKRPQNCGTGYCSCVECVMEPAPVQKPMAWMRKNEDCADCITWFKTESNTVPLYTTPPAAQRQWVGLTDEEMDELVNRFARYELVRAIEALLKQKNT